MACRSVLRSVMASEPWRPLHQSGSFRSFPSRNFGVYSSGRANCGYPATAEARNVRAIRPARFYSSRHGAPDADHDQAPPHEAVLKAISEVSKTEGRVGQTTNVIIGSTGTDDAIDEWFALDKKVNSYPTVRGFIAIGTGGDDFVQSMVVAVESVIRQSIPQERVRQKLSSRGKYVSVNIGPVRVVSSEQVQAVYNAMRRDDRMKYFL